MFPIILERDTPIIDWSAYVDWATTLSSLNAASFNVRSDGLLKGDYGSLYSKANTGVITAGNVTCAGVHLPGPEPGVEFTPYAVSCIAMAEDDDVRPLMFIGESPVTITSDVTGDVVTGIRMLGFAHAVGDQGSHMEREMTVVVTELTADRALCFGVAMAAGSTGGATAAGMVSLSVRRLIGPGPRIVDARKL